MGHKKEIESLLRRMGSNSSYCGFNYTVYGIVLAIQDRERLVYITKGIYPDVAKEFNTSWKCVERDIRTVVDVIWNYGDRELLERVRGIELNQKPQNKEFIEMMAEYIKNMEEEERVTK